MFTTVAGTGVGFFNDRSESRGGFSKHKTVEVVTKEILHRLDHKNFKLKILQRELTGK